MRRQEKERNFSQHTFKAVNHESSISIILIFLSLGPQKWHEKFPLANGIRQSPVNIMTSNTKTSNDLSMNPLRWTYVPENTKCLINPGYCWRVDVNGKGSELTGGPLNDDIYLVEQFHCHWGCSDGRGSEHTVDGQAFSGELHIVHWNSTKYQSFKEAAGHPDGLAVLGVFMKVIIFFVICTISKVYLSQLEALKLGKQIITLLSVQFRWENNTMNWIKLLA